MRVATTGLVLRQVKVGEADQILTLLTPDRGVISASARGSLHLKNKRFSACGLFCYSEFSLSSGRNAWFVDDAQIVRGFHNLSSSVAVYGLATYLAELTIEQIPADTQSDAQLRLLLNSFYMLNEGKRPLRQVKAIYELRSMVLEGYMPNILACADCGRYEGGNFRLGPQDGILLCEECAGKRNLRANLDPGALFALRHICLCEEKTLFNFKLKPECLLTLGETSEEYCLSHIEHTPKSLRFLKTVLE